MKQNTPVGNALNQSSLVKLGGDQQTYLKNQDFGRLPFMSKCVRFQQWFIHGVPAYSSRFWSRVQVPMSPMCSKLYIRQISCHILPHQPRIHLLHQFGKVGRSWLTLVDRFQSGTGTDFIPFHSHTKRRLTSENLTKSKREKLGSNGHKPMHM